MSVIVPSDLKLSWHSALSFDEVQEWIRKGQKPKVSLESCLAKPGIYRFVWPESTDPNGSHRACYIGEAEDVGKRLSDHFNLQDEDLETLPGWDLDSGWQVRGANQLSSGDVIVQLLKVEGSIRIQGVLFNEHSLSDPFARRFFENWAILYSQQVDHYQVKNRGMSQETKNFWKKARLASEASPFQGDGEQMTAAIRALAGTGVGPALSLAQIMKFIQEKEQ